MTAQTPPLLKEKDILLASGLSRRAFEWVPEAWPLTVTLGHIGSVAAGVTVVAVLLAAPNFWWLLAGPAVGAVLFWTMGEAGASVGLVGTVGLWCWQVWLGVSGKPVLILAWLGALVASAGLTWFAAQRWRQRQRRKLGVESLARLLADIERYNMEVRSFCAARALAAAQGESAAEHAESRVHLHRLEQARSDLLRSLQVDRVMREHRGTLGELSFPVRRKRGMETIAIDHRAQVAREHLRDRLVEAADHHDGVEAARRISAKG